MRPAPRRRWALLVLAASLPSCSSPNVRVQGTPATAGPEWIELQLAEAVSPQRPRQEIVVTVDAPGARAKVVLGPPKDAPPYREITLADGRVAAVFAEARMRDGTAKPLRATGAVCVERRTTCTFWFDPPAGMSKDDGIEAIRVRSTERLEVTDAYWTDYRPGP